MKKITALLSIFSLVFLLNSCSEDRGIVDYTSDEFALISEQLTLPKTVQDYELHLGEHFLPEGASYPQINTVSIGSKEATNNKATLGRVLFYDQTLSLDRNVSCGSCHHPQKAFSDGEQFSLGVEEVATRRNSMALATTLSFKISYNPIDPTLSRSKFSWDDAAANLPAQVKQAFRTENQMNIDDDEIKLRIAESPHYDVLFNKAFGTGEVNADRIAEAITSFVDAISSTNSKFDEGLEYAPGFSVDVGFYNFTEEENLGKALFNQNCASCHTNKHNFTIKPSANNGLDMDYSDKGIGGRLGDPSLYGVFKVPFLRNIALTAPYMHDGRFLSLEEVVDHYSDNMVLHNNLSEELRDESGQANRLNLNDKDKKALVAYLHTLTDYSVISDERFSDPFKK